MANGGRVQNPHTQGGVWGTRQPKAVSVMKMKSGKNRTLKTVGCATCHY